MKIVVLAGGLSTERHVALVSGTGVCRALRERGHQAILVDMFLGLENYSGRLEDIFDAPDGLCSDVRVESEAPDLEAVRRSRRDQSPSLLGKDVLQVCMMADIVFLALHGECGEDGRIQATLDLLGVPYTGSGYLGSGMAMDKSVTKRFMDAEGIRTAPWHNIVYSEADIPQLVEKLEVPCAVKTVNGGSSIGVELPDTKEKLADALRHMLRFGEAGKYILSVFFVKGNKYFETKIPHSASKEGNVGFSMPWGWRKRRPDLPYFFWGSPSGKMILLTKKKTTIFSRCVIANRSRVLERQFFALSSRADSGILKREAAPAKSRKGEAKCQIKPSAPMSGLFRACGAAQSR